MYSHVWKHWFCPFTLVLQIRKLTAGKKFPKQTLESVESSLEHFPLCYSFPWKTSQVANYWQGQRRESWELPLIEYLLYTRLCSRHMSPALCDPMDCSQPGSSVHGFSRQEYWSGLPFPSPGQSSWTKDRTWVSYRSCIGRQVFYH